MSDMCAFVAAIGETVVDSCQTVIVCVCLIWASVDAVIVSPSWLCDVGRVSSFDPSFFILDARGELRRLKPYFCQEDWTEPFPNWTATELRTTTIPLLFIYHLYKYMLHLDCTAILNNLELSCLATPCVIKNSVKYQKNVAIVNILTILLNKIIILYDVN